MSGLSLITKGLIDTRRDFFVAPSAKTVKAKEKRPTVNISIQDITLKARTKSNKVNIKSKKKFGAKINQKKNTLRLKK